MNGHIIWEAISDYGYVFLTIVGVIVVLGIVYRQRKKSDDAPGGG